MLDLAVRNVDTHGDVVGFQHRFNKGIDVFLKPTTCQILHLIALQRAFSFGRKTDVIQEFTKVWYRCHTVFLRMLSFGYDEKFPVAILLTQSFHNLKIAIAQKVFGEHGEQML